jgi:transcriptional regulator with XRE-family HTH domain
MTQRQLGEQTGMSPERIAGWESGRKPPTREKLARVCDVLGLDPSELFDLDELSHSYRERETIGAELRRVGALLRSRRVAAGLSIPQAAKASGSVPPSIRRWEVGEVHASKRHMRALCDAYGITGDERAELVAFARPDKAIPQMETRKKRPAMQHETTDRGPQIRRGSIWRRADGRTVVIEAHAHEGEAVRYRPLPDGDMMRLAWATFRAKYREVLS